MERIATLNMISLIEGICGVVLTVIALVVLGWGVPGTLMSSIAAGIVALGATVRVLCQHDVSFRPHWDRSVVRETLGFGLKKGTSVILSNFLITASTCLL